MAGYRGFDIPRFRGDLAAAAPNGAGGRKSPEAGISQIRVAPIFDDPLPIVDRRPMTPFSLLLVSLVAAIIMFGGSVLIAMVLLERPLRKKLAAKRATGNLRSRG